MLKREMRSAVPFSGWLHRPGGMSSKGPVPWVVTGLGLDLPRGGKINSFPVRLDEPCAG